jgi:hypothetical protein
MRGLITDRNNGGLRVLGEDKAIYRGSDSEYWRPNSEAKFKIGAEVEFEPSTATENAGTRRQKEIKIANNLELTGKRYATETKKVSISPLAIIEFIGRED